MTRTWRGSRAALAVALGGAGLAAPGAPAGCGGGAAGPSATSVADSFCADLITVAIDRTFACSGGSRPAVQGLYDRDAFCARAAASLAAGRLGFDPAFGAACLDWLHTFPCSPSLALLPHPEGPCARVFAGQVPDDGACQMLGALVGLSECVGAASFCALPAGACAGTCRSYALENDPCGDPLPPAAARLCLPGTICDPDLGTCRRVSGLGEICKLGLDGSFDARGVVLACGEGNACVPDAAGGDATCEVTHASGACSTASECRGRCLDPTGSGANCYPPRALGEACSDPGRADACGYGTSCGLSGTCITAPITPPSPASCG